MISLNTPRAPKYASLILDVDSTLCGVEGIDWLARRRSQSVAAQIASLTEKAMNGDVPLESVYGERLALIRPNTADIDALAAEYGRTLAADASQVLSRLRSAGVRVALVSGGIRQAIEPLAGRLGFVKSDLFAVELEFDSAGQYSGYDSESPLTSQSGKRRVAATLGLRRPALAVGDGSTDVEMRGALDGFAAYVGFVKRESVIRVADHVLASYAELASLILG